MTFTSPNAMSARILSARAPRALTIPPAWRPYARLGVVLAATAMSVEFCHDSHGRPHMPHKF